ncbi:MAG: prolyl oligopeptidase family serine peptidase [Firmicutes bacterium]|nr:prolyl oligopeptidase family serine peptidase [Bacillota bacterium]
MKKIIAVIMVLAMVFALAACGQTPANNAAPSNNAAPANNTTPANTTPANNATPANNSANEGPKAVIATKSPNGQNYSWVPSQVFFKEDAEVVFRDYAETQLLHKLQTKDGVICMSLDDLYRLYAPDFKVTIDGDKIKVEHATLTAEATVGSKELTTYAGKEEMAVAPYKADETIFVPVFDFMCKSFQKFSSDATKLTKFYCLSDTEDKKINRNDTYQLEKNYRAHVAGLYQYTYWFEEVERLEPVVVYIPSTYDPAKPNKMIVQLHGAGGNCIGNATKDSGYALCEGAERYGYIVAFCNGYCASCNFGQIVQPAGLFPITEKTDPKNPANYSEGQLKDIEHSGHDVQEGIKFVESKYSIDTNNLFIMGISMGGCGTWYQVAAHPGMFNACSPAGAFVEPEFFDWSQVKTPTLYIGGTEDRNGFDLMLRAYNIAKSQGANIVKFETVGGAPPGGEWPQRIDMTLEFFDSYLKK